MSAITWRATTAERATDVLFLAALLSVSFKGLRWEIAGLSPQLADFLITAFLLAFLVERATSSARRPPRAVTVVLACAGGLALVYLAGATGIETRSGVAQFGKGLAYFVLHFAFLAAGVGHLISRSPRYYRVSLACFLVGLGLNAGYAALQLLTAKLGVSIDAAVLSPITGRPARSLSYGLANGPDVLRARGLTLDPNHLGAMLLLPVLMLTAFSVRGVDLRWPRTRAALLGALGLVLVATLSRSALLGLAAGAVLLVVRYGRRLLTRPVVVPTAGVALILLSIVALNRGFYSRVLGARLDIRGEDRIQHLHVYEVLGPALTEHPLFGVGLNNYALTYAPHVDGRVEASLSLLRPGARRVGDPRGHGDGSPPRLRLSRSARAATHRAIHRNPRRHAARGSGLGPDGCSSRDRGGEYRLPDDVLLVLLCADDLRDRCLREGHLGASSTLAGPRGTPASRPSRRRGP